LPEKKFSTLKTAIKLNKNVKNPKIANILETAGNPPNSCLLKALLLGVLTGRIIGFK